MLSEGLNSLIPKFHSLLKEPQEAGREYPRDAEHLCKPTENTWKAAVALPAESQTQSQVQSGMWKCTSSTHSLFCKQIVPTSQEVGIWPAIWSLPHWSITQFGLEPLSTFPWEGESLIPEEKKSGGKDAATFDNSPRHFQFPRAATAHL